MTASALEKELKQAAGGAVLISLSELATLTGYKDAQKLRRKIIADDPDSRVPVLRPVIGKRYSIKELAIRLIEAGGREDETRDSESGR